MVVVVIIGILVAIAIPIYNSVQTNAELRACQANQRTIGGAWQMRLADSTTPLPAWPAGYMVGASITGTTISLPDMPTTTCGYTLDATTGIVTCANVVHN